MPGAVVYYYYLYKDKPKIKKIYHRGLKNDSNNNIVYKTFARIEKIIAEHFLDYVFL
jgi:hypothetical protein